MTLHGGQNKISGTIKHYYVLEEKTKIIKKVLKDCLTCLKNKDLNNTKGFFIGTLHSIIPMKNLTTDIVGPFDLNWDGEVGKTWSQLL